jgi:hypothetical protein
MWTFRPRVGLRQLLIHAPRTQVVVYHRWGLGGCVRGKFQRVKLQIAARLDVTKSVEQSSAPQGLKCQMAIP